MTDKELARVTTDAINNFSFSSKEFCKQMDMEHRTLQQSFTRLCIAWLRHCAELEHYDGRNEASVRVGRIVAQALDDNNIHNVPMV